VLEREVVGRQGAHHVEQQAAGQHDGALTLGRGIHADADAEFHVGGLELDGAGLRPDHHAGERLDRATRGDAAHGDAELVQELVT